MKVIFSPTWLDLQSKKKNTEETHHLLVATLTPRVLYDCKAIGEKNLFEAEKKHSSRTQ